MQAPARHPGAAASPWFGTEAAASPGQMRLQAVRKGDLLVDFTWESVCGAAARLLDCAPQDLLGQRLCSQAAGPLGHPALIDLYRRVLEYGNTQCFEQIHLVDGRQDLILHRVSRAGDGVAVTLTNLSSDR